MPPGSPESPPAFGGCRFITPIHDHQSPPLHQQVPDPSLAENTVDEQNWEQSCYEDYIRVFCISVCSPGDRTLARCFDETYSKPTYRHSDRTKSKLARCSQVRTLSAAGDLPPAPCTWCSWHVLATLTPLRQQPTISQFLRHITLCQVSRSPVSPVMKQLEIKFRLLRVWELYIDSRHPLEVKLVDGKSQERHPDTQKLCQSGMKVKLANSGTAGYNGR